MLRDFLRVEVDDGLVVGHDVARDRCEAGQELQSLNIFVADLLISMNMALTSTCFFAVASTRELRAARCSRYLWRSARSHA